MILLLLAGLFFAGAAVAFLARAASMRRVRTTENLEQIDAYGFAGSATEPPKKSAVRDALDDVASAIGGAVGGRLGRGREADMKLKLMAAGLYSTAPRKFLGYRVICAACVPASAVWAAAAVGASGPLTLLAIVLGTLAGWQAPMTVVRSRAERRLGQVDYDLPELIDVLIVTVEAGLGFNGSLRVAAERLPGPLGDELRLTLQEQNMGLATSEALTHLLDRCETPAMRSFVRSILQGETLGVSIGEILRNLAEEMRKRRRAAAEERAQKAPIKLLFPLIFLIFPAIFIILLGPALFQFLDAFRG